VQSCKDGDTQIDPKEAPMVALRLQMQLEPYGIQLDTDTFQTMIREDNDIFNMLRFCGLLLFEKESYDHGDEDSVDSELTFDFESFCRTFDDEPRMSQKMTYEEKAGMATVGEKLSKGSVEVARGGRMKLMPGDNKMDARRKTILKEVQRRQTKMKTRRVNH